MFDPGETGPKARRTAALSLFALTVRTLVTNATTVVVALRGLAKFCKGSHPYNYLPGIVTRFCTETHTKTNMTFKLIAALAAVSFLSTPVMASEVGNYVGVGVNLNRQGVDGTEYTSNRTVAGVAVQSRFRLSEPSKVSASARPYFNFAAGPNSQTGTAAGVLGTVDFSLTGREVAGSYMSDTNLYVGVGGQWALTNNGQANYQTSVGQGSQFLFVAGVERSFSPSLVGFADVKFPTQTNGISGTAYAPVGTVGLGFKF